MLPGRTLQRLLPVLFFGAAGCATEPSATLIATPDAVVFSGFGATPAPQTLQLTNPSGTIDWSASSDVSWLSILPPSGSAIPAVITVTATADGLPGGLVTGTMRLSAAHGVLSVPVFLDVPLATGVWSGTVLGNIGLLLALKDSSGVISGTGAFVGTDGTQLPLTIAGVHVHPGVVFTLNAPLFAPATISAVFVSPTTLSGTITGSSFTGDALTLTHQ